MIHLLSIMDIPVQYVSIFAIGRLQDPSKLLMYTYSPFLKKILSQTGPNKPFEFSGEFVFFLDVIHKPLARDLSLPIVHVYGSHVSIPQSCRLRKVVWLAFVREELDSGSHQGILSIRSLTAQDIKLYVASVTDVPIFRYVFHLLLPRGSFHRFDMFTAKKC